MAKKREELDDVFGAMCDATVDALGSYRDAEDKRGLAALIKSGIDLLKFTGHEVEFEHSEQARQVANNLTLLSSGGEMPPEFEDDDYEDEAVG